MYPQNTVTRKQCRQLVRLFNSTGQPVRKLNPDYMDIDFLRDKATDLQKTSANSFPDFDNHLRDVISIGHSDSQLDDGFSPACSAFRTQR